MRRFFALSFLLPVLLLLGGCPTTDLTSWGGQKKPQTQAEPPPPKAAPKEKVVARVLPPPKVESQPAPPPGAEPAQPPRDEQAPLGSTVIPSEQTVAPELLPDGQLRAAEEQVTLIPPPAAPVVPKGVLKVGLLLPLSGQAGHVGNAILNAAQLAMFEIADQSFALLPADTKGSVDGAQQAARQVINQGAQLILGPLFAAEAKAIAPLTRGAGVNVVSFSTDRTVAGDSVYVMGILPGAQVERIVAHAAAKGVSNFATLAPANDYGRMVAEEMRAAVTAQGGMVTDIEYYDPTASDHTAVVKKLARYELRRKALMDERRKLEAKGDDISRQALSRLAKVETLGEVPFDALLVPDEGGRMKAVAALLPYYDIDPARVRMLGTMLWEDPSLSTEPALVGGWYAAPPPAERLDFEVRYAKVYGAKPPRIASLGYDAVALAATLSLMGDVGTRGLTVSNGFAGVDGIFRFRSNGLVERGLAVMEVQRGQHKTLSPAPQNFVKGTN